MAEARYNGWANRETWACSLHIDNDQGSYNFARELMAEAHKGATEPDEPRWRLREALKDWIEREVETVHFEPAEATEWARMMAHDVGSVWRVNWDELARHMLEEEGEGNKQ